MSRFHLLVEARWIIICGLPAYCSLYCSSVLLSIRCLINFWWPLMTLLPVVPPLIQLFLENMPKDLQCPDAPRRGSCWRFWKGLLAIEIVQSCWLYRYSAQSTRRVDWAILSELPVRYTDHLACSEKVSSGFHLLLVESRCTFWQPLTALQVVSLQPACSKNVQAPVRFRVTSCPTESSRPDRIGSFNG